MERKSLRKQSVEFFSGKGKFGLHRFLGASDTATSFDLPLGPSAECLSVEQIHSLVQGQLAVEQGGGASQHLRDCDVCSSFVDAYVGARPEGMPQALYDQIPELLGGKGQTSESPGLSLAVWLSIEHKFRWIAAAAVLLVLWISYPYSGPYLQKALSYSNAAFHAYLERDERRREEVRLRQVAQWHLAELAGVDLSDPKDAQSLVEDVKAAAIRGYISEPGRIATARENLETNWRATEPGVEAAKLWGDYVMELAGAEAVVRYELLRKAEGLDVVSLVSLGITEISSDEGIPRLTVESKQITDPSVKFLMQRSIRSTGLRRLEVYRGSTLVYSFSQ